MNIRHLKLPRAAVLFVLFAAFFLIANKGAYKGYFQDDDLDNLSFTREIGLPDFLKPLVSPTVYQNNFRPVGHLFYHWMGAAAGLNYIPYIATIHLLHLLNVALLWMLLRRLGFEPLAALAGCLFWGFHMALFDVFWKPMYVFDLLCGLFCLLSLLAYVNGHWLWSLLAMWLAYRSKEVAIMLPVMIASYEFLLGSRRWKRLVPFFALSLILGVQALLNNQQAEGSYALRFDPSSLWTCIEFYASKIFLIPAAGLLILPLAITRDRRVLLGALGFCVLLLPMLLLPGRLSGAYLYIPLIGLAIMAAAFAARATVLIVAVFFAVWIPWNYVNLRWDRRVTMADFDDRRKFVQRLAEFSEDNPDVLTFVTSPGPLNNAGTKGAIKMVHKPNTPIVFDSVDSRTLKSTMERLPLAVLTWDSRQHDLDVALTRADVPDASYIKMGRHTPIQQLEQGWYEADAGYRWTQPHATARLRRPEGVRHFELVVNVGDEYIQTIKKSHVEIRVDGTLIGSQDFDQHGYHTVRWDLPPAPPGTVKVDINVSPEFRGARVLGIAVASFGFLP